MTSPSPLLYDTCYHIYNRGNNHENIFIQERNYTHFMNLYFKYIEPVAETYAYCLLRNHFHLAVKIKSEQEILDTRETLRVFSANSHLVRPANHAIEQACLPTKPPALVILGLGSTYVSQQFSNFFNAYAKAINTASGRSGSLFQHPFGRVLVANEHQFWNVIAYIHQNPQKHKFVDDFRDWSYSSYGVLLSEKPTRLQRDTVLDWFGGKQSYLDLQAQLVTEADSRAFSGEDYD